jgi:hypothetical protein
MPWWARPGVEMNKAVGYLFAGMIVLAAVSWVPLHFSGIAVLYGRTDEEPIRGGFSSIYPVKCHYFTSLGTIDKDMDYYSAAGRAGYYCPRWRKLNE